ncbi:hypothetical protein POPTR_005G218950v4 [Populus trichocarpa]|jgi:hypothetical protein|uniref:Uncharacterized protein n=1 Tax=Populus trichocarpa TaxID=3694 RepID=A0ACC0T1B8_POPTR|nr:hypothetical protein BDE02_05G184600 [Populus trichocarpa]KAI9395335.1 hypothetical protein POPTR_005G218950v4 [Populus trichocarpa]
MLSCELWSMVLQTTVNLFYAPPVYVTSPWDERDARHGLGAPEPLTGKDHGPANFLDTKGLPSDHCQQEGIRVHPIWGTECLISNSKSMPCRDRKWTCIAYYDL